MEKARHITIYINIINKWRKKYMYIINNKLTINEKREKKEKYPRRGEKNVYRETNEREEYGDFTRGEIIN